MKLKGVIRKIFEKKEIFVFWFTLGFYFFLFLNLNNKTFVFFFFVYLFALYLYLRNFKLSLLLAYLASWPFNIGKSYVFELVSPSKLNLAYHSYGIGPIMMISVKEIFIVLMLLMLLRDNFLRKKKVFIFDKKGLLLVFYIFSLVISSLVGSIRPDISMILSFFSISLLILYWYLRSLLDKKGNLLKLAISVVCSILLFEGLLASLQFLRHSTLGVSIEAANFLPFDYATESENAYYYRSIGTFAHANGFANFLLVLIFSLLPSIFIDYGHTRFFSFLVGAWALFLTLGRSAWGSFFVAFLLFLFIAEKRWRMKLKIIKNVPRIFFLCLPFIIPLFVFILFPRIKNTIYSFELYGAGYTRAKMIKEVWETIQRFPLFGIGLEMEPYYYYEISLFRRGSVFSYFPEAVHNGYLSHLVQTGIFSFLLYLAILFSFIKNLINKILLEKTAKGKIFCLALVCGLVSLCLNSILQPFIPDLQNIIFWSMIYKIKGKDV